MAIKMEEIFQFHQGLSFYVKTKESFSMFILSIPSRIIPYTTVLYIYNLYQPFNSIKDYPPFLLSFTIFFILPTFNSIKDYHLIMANQNLAQLEAFNSIKDYRLFVLVSVGLPNTAFNSIKDYLTP